MADNPSLRRTLILSLYLPTLLLAFGMGMLVPVLPVYARSFGISYKLVGLVLASQGLGNLLGDVPSGVLMGRLGQKWSMQVGLCVLALSMIAMGLAGSVPGLAIFGFTGGLGMSLWNISRHAYMTHTIPLYMRGRATATFGGINRIGMFAAPAVGGFVAGLFEMRTPIVLYGILTCVALAVVAAFAVDDGERSTIAGSGVSGHTSHLLSVFHEHYRILLSAGLGQFLGQMIRAGRRVVIPLSPRMY